MSNSSLQYKKVWSHIQEVHVVPRGVAANANGSGGQGE